MNNCFFCGTSENIITFDNHHFCLSCASKTLICTGCNKLVLKDNSVYLAGEGVYCNGCVGTTNTCSDCGKNMIGGAETVDGKPICKICVKKYKRCPSCNKYHNFIIEKDIYLMYNHVLAENTCRNCSDKVIRTATPQTLYECACCGEKTNRKYIVGLNDKKVVLCPSCKENYHVCPECGDLVKRDTCIYVRGDILTCSKCITTKYINCRGCGNYHKKENCDGNLCKDCKKKLRWCGHCKRFKDKSGFEEIKKGNKKINICADCVRGSRNYCAICEQYKKYTWSYGRSTYVCLDCFTENNMGEICYYSYKPTPIFFGDGPLYFGFENEVSFSNNIKDTTIYERVGTVESVQEGLLYCKHDGSIPNGFEIVSHPMSFLFFKSLDWTPMFDIKAARSTACGMHVHMSKEAFTQSHLFRFMLFLNNNQEFTEFIAQRSSNNYCKKYDKKAILRKAKEKLNSDRYEAVNLTNNATIEVRIFKYAANITEFNKNLEFCQALYNFTKNRSIKELTPAKFIEFIKGNADFSALNTFCKK